jgi:tetratricopeptide (TPR) repeat protein
MNCTNCQTNLPESAKFCSECGQRVSQPETQTDQIKSESSNTTAFSKPLQAFGLIFGAVAVAVLIVVLILDSNRQATAEKKEISSTPSEIPEEVKVQLEKLEADPESIPLNIETGNLLFDVGRFDEAIPFYQKALSKDSLNIGVQIDLAVCFFNLRDAEQAIVEMKKALKIDPTHSKGLFNMGIIYYNMGQFENVRKYWEKLMVVHPESMEAARARELLQSIDN